MAVASKRLKPRKAPVQPRAVETRDRILAAAARVFSRHGYAAGTTNRIAAEAHLSVGSLYQYFPNKDAILVELMRRHVDAGVRTLHERLLDRDLPSELADRLGVFVDATIANHVDDPDLHQVLFEEAPRPPELLAELHDMERALIESASALLAADPAVRIADHAIAARLVVTTIESLVHRVVATRDRTVDLEAFRRELIAMLVRYLRG
jgi:AcrR family transcriptional regulator